MTLTRVLPGNTQVLWWALSLGACLGGNGTLVGASANVTTVGLAEKSGTRVSFSEFMKFGWPAMMITVSIASAFIALHVLVGDGRARMLSWVAAVVCVVFALRPGFKTPSL